MNSAVGAVRTIIDCDPGIDDAIALAVALRHTDVVGITTVGGNVGLEHTTRNALALCETLGAEKVPVHAGQDLPMSGRLDHRAAEFHGPQGTGSVELAAPSKEPTSHDAVEWLIETIRGEEGLTLIPTGPLTNIAHAITAAPDLVDRVAGVSWMGGSSGAGNTTPAAEFNAWVDPEAADIVFRAGFANLVMAGLNITHQVLVDRVWIENLRKAITDPAMTVFADLLDYYEDRTRAISALAGAAMHDAVAVINVSHPHLLGGVARPVEVVVAEGPTRGMTLVDSRSRREPAPPTATVLEWGDINAIRSVIFNSLTGHR